MTPNHFRHTLRNNKRLFRIWVSAWQGWLSHSQLTGSDFREWAGNRREVLWANIAYEKVEKAAFWLYAPIPSRSVSQSLNIIWHRSRCLLLDRAVIQHLTTHILLPVSRIIVRKLKVCSASQTNHSGNARSWRSTTLTTQTCCQSTIGSKRSSLDDRR